jgi:hypothetical protein
MITMESLNSSVVRTEPQKNAPCSIYLREGTALVGLTLDDYLLTPTRRRWHEGDRDPDRPGG